MGKGESMDCCGSCIKVLMVVFNIIFWLLGLIVLIGGIVMLAKPGLTAEVLSKVHVSINMDTFPIQNAAIVLTMAGGVTFLLGFLGCCGASTENKCMLGLFFVFMLLIVLLQLAAGIYIAVYRLPLGEKLDSIIKDKMKEEFRSGTNGSQEAMDKFHLLEGQFNCCGLNGLLDYAPFHPEDCNSTVPRIPAPPGCLKAVTAATTDMLNTFLFILMGIGFGVGFVEMLGLVFAMVLACKIGNSDSFEYSQSKLVT